MLLRCSGEIVRLDAREGISTTTGKAWRIPQASVLVTGRQGVAEINVPDQKHVQLEVGEIVDWLVDVETRGGYVSVRYVSDLAPLAPVLGSPDDQVHVEFTNV